MKLGRPLPELVLSVPRTINSLSGLGATRPRRRWRCVHESFWRVRRMYPMARSRSNHTAESRQVAAALRRASSGRAALVTSKVNRRKSTGTLETATSMPAEAARSQPIAR